MLRRLGQLGIVLGLGLPAFLSFNFVYRFSVDVPFWDAWELVVPLQQMSDGTLTLKDLFALHNEHRIFFPRLLMLGLAKVSGWDTRYEQWLGWTMMVGVGALLLREHLKTFGRGWLAAALFIPSAWLIFSLRQQDNLLWGWQIQIFLCALALCFSMVSLVAADRGWPILGAAIGGAIVCTFSFAAGLAVWPAGLLCLLWRLFLVRDPALKARRLGMVGGWVLVGAIATALYLSGYAKPGGHPSTGYALEHPLRAAYFYLAAVGGVLTTEPDPAGGAAKGFALLLVFAALAYATFRGWIDADKASLGIPLIAFAFANSAMVTVGRVGFEEGSGGIGTAAASRYTTLSLLGIVGLYRCCLALRAERLRTAASAAMVLLVLLGTFVTLDTAFSLGTEVRRVRRELRATLIDWRNRDDAQLLAAYPDAAVVRQRAASLENMKLSVFRDGPVQP